MTEINKQLLDSAEVRRRAEERLAVTEKVNFQPNAAMVTRCVLSR